MENLSEGMVEEIIKLRRVPKRHRDSARSRLMALGTGELATKLDRLKAQRAAIDDWRESYKTQVLEMDSGAQHTTKPDPHERSPIDEVPVPVPAAIAPKPLWQVAAAEADRVDIRDLIVQAVAHDKIESSGEPDSYFRGKLRDIIEAAIAKGARPVDAHPLVSNLSVGGYVEALGRIENDITYRRPDAFVAINEEGKSVAQLLADHMQLKTPIYNVVGAADTAIKWVDHVDTPPDFVICVMGHVVHSGNTMKAVISASRVKFRTDKVYGASIAASTRALANSLKSEEVVFHQRLRDDKLRFVHEYKGRPSDTKDEYIVVAGSEGDAVKLEGGVLDDVRRYMAKVYPTAGRATRESFEG